MSNLHYFFYELPGNPVWPDGLDRVILSGFPIDAEPNPEFNPFGFETTYQLDERSQKLIGQETVAVSFVDLVEDEIKIPINTPPAKVRKPTPKPPVPAFEQLQFDFNVPQALSFKRSVITINGAETKGYTVEGLDTKIFRGLQVVVVKSRNRWLAYEATTGTLITPPSWAGGYSNKTRAGIIQIMSNFLSDTSKSRWASIQRKLDYDLEV